MITIKIEIDYEFPNITYPVISKTTLNNEEVISKTLATYQEAKVGVDLDEFYSSFKNHIIQTLNSKKTIDEERIDKKRDFEYYELHQAMGYFRRLMSDHWMENSNG